MVNRSAITVTAKQPFLDWLYQLPNPVGCEITLDHVNEERHVYLVPDYELNSEREEILQEFFDLIWEIELDGWWTEESDWPVDRSLDEFKRWFDIKFHSLVEDLVNEPLFDED
jgi:hypothetical protein